MERAPECKSSSSVGGGGSGKAVIWMIWGSLVYYHYAYKNSSILTLLSNVFLVLLSSFAILGLLFRHLNISGQIEPNLIVVERHGNGTSKRYVLDNDLQVRTFRNEHGFEKIKTKGLQGSKFSNVQLSWLPDAIKDFISQVIHFSQSFFKSDTESVSDDYLEYMLL